MNSKIWLSSPHIGDTELNFIREAFETNWVAPVGANIDEFEHDLEYYLKEDSQITALITGTAALHLALVLCGIGWGDEVVCQTMTFSASANPIKYVGANPIFVDSELETWNLCPVSLEKAILDRISKGKKPKAIIAVHLYGMPFQVNEIVGIANKYKIPLIEDAADALGSSYQNQKCGTFGELAALSFNGNKIITTSGGGALVCKTEEEKKRTVFLATQARDEASHYQHSQIGYNYRLSNICAGIGRGQMQVLDEHIALRRANHAFYVDLFKSIEGVTVFSEPNSDFFSNYWLTCILIDEKIVGKNREQLRLAFSEENIESRPLWKPMHLQPVFEGAPFYGGTVAEDLFNRGLCLPSGSNLTEAQRERIADVIRKFFK